jgi:phosphoesterase RecJ-like protein
VRAGVRPWELAKRAEESWPVARLKLLARVLDSLERVGPVALLSLPAELLASSGASPGLADGFVNYARALDGVDVGVLLTELPGGVRVSLRSKGGHDVAKVAARFGGGGHRAAAGCLIPGRLADARRALLDAFDTARGEPGARRGE